MDPIEKSPYPEVAVASPTPIHDPPPPGSVVGVGVRQPPDDGAGMDLDSVTDTVNRPARIPLTDGSSAPSCHPPLFFGLAVTQQRPATINGVSLSEGVARASARRGASLVFRLLPSLPPSLPPSLLLLASSSSLFLVPSSSFPRLGGVGGGKREEGGREGAMEGGRQQRAGSPAWEVTS